MAKRPRTLFCPTNEVICAPWQDRARGLVAIPGGYFAHTITDPPYSEWVHAKKMSGSTKGAIATPVTFAALGADELIAVASQIVRTTRGWALIFCADDDIRAWRDALEAAGAMRRVTCIWTKPNGTPRFHGDGPAQACEHIVTVWCGDGRPVWNGGGKLGRYDVPTEPSKTRRHETQKPIRLMKNLVLDFTAPGDLIADPYGGGGTTGAAAKMCGRRFVLWEVDPGHAERSDVWTASTSEQLDMERLYHRARPGAFGDVRPLRDKAAQSELDLVATEPT